MSAVPDILASLCRVADEVPAHSGIVPALLLAGLAGSAVHCVPMCGGFVLGQAADRIARVPAARLCEWRRLTVGVALPYQAGRICTYAALGAAAGSTGGAMARLPLFGVLSSVLLILAATLFALHALRRLAPAWAGPLSLLERSPAGWQRGIAGVTRRIGGRRPLRGFPLGVALGFLPCGFLYAALAAAAATFSPVAGALGMAAFGLGTVPALAVVGIAGQAAAHRWRRGVAKLAPAVLLLNAGLLALLGVRLLIG